MFDFGRFIPTTPTEVVLNNRIRELERQLIDANCLPADKTTKEISMDYLPDRISLPRIADAYASRFHSDYTVGMRVRVFNKSSGHFEMAHYADAQEFTHTTFDIAAELHKRCIYELAKALKGES